MDGDMIEGVMEVTELDPDHAMSVVIRDGPAAVRSRITVEPIGKQSSLLTVHVESDDTTARLEESWIQHSLDRAKELIESET